MRKEILKEPDQSQVPRSDLIDVAAVARVLVTSEDADHPVERAFDGRGGPGGTRWVAAGDGEQTLIVAFDNPRRIRGILLEIEELEVGRTQQLQVAVSTDGGGSYRELVRQEYNFSPPDTSFERERWSAEAEGVTHLRLVITPDKGGKRGRASLTTLALH